MVNSQTKYFLVQLTSDTDGYTVVVDSESAHIAEAEATFMLDESYQVTNLIEFDTAAARQLHIDKWAFLQECATSAMEIFEEIYMANSVWAIELYQEARLIPHCFNANAVTEKLFTALQVAFNIEPTQ